MEYLVAGAQTFIGGQDASKIPDQIEGGYFAASVNTSNRRAALQPRWGGVKLKVSYSDGYLENSFKKQNPYQNIFETGKYQATIPFQIGNVPHLVIVISGCIFLYNQITRNISYLPIETTDSSVDRLNGRATRINWTAAGKHLVLFDFPAYPVILDGVTARRADPALYEIPAALMGVYNSNRLFIANGGNEFTAGDPVGSTATPNAPITFEEVLLTGSTYYGQIFQLPTFDTNEAITAMAFLQMADTSTGIGPLLVGTDKAIYSYATQNLRSTWEQGQFGSVLTYNTGIAGARAICNVNSDLFFMSSDGQVRSLSMSREEQGKWSKVPISLEVQNWLNSINPDLFKYTVISYFKNKVFILANPYRVAATDFTTSQPIADYCFGGMVVLEMDSMTKFGSTSNPSWAGLWTGVRPSDIAVNGEQCFIMAKEDGKNVLYELDPSKTYDVVDDKIYQVKSRIYTKEYDFDDPFTNKELHSLDVNWGSIKGDFSFSVSYKPSHTSDFLFWRNVQFTIPWFTKGVPSNEFLQGYAPQTVRDFTIGSPVDFNNCDPSFKEYYRTFRKVQLQFDISAAYWELHEFRIKAVPKVKAEIDTVCKLPVPVAKPIAACNSDWLIGEHSLCLT